MSILRPGNSDPGKVQDCSPSNPQPATSGENHLHPGTLAIEAGAIDGV
jgi:hypothetical protein